MSLIDDVRTELSALRAMVLAEFASDRRQRDQQHAENRESAAEDRAEWRERFDRVEAKQDLTNGNVSRHEEAIRTIFEQLKTLFRWFHLGHQGAPDKKDSDKKGITERDVRLVVVSLGAGVALLKFFEWLIRALKP